MDDMRDYQEPAIAIERSDEFIAIAQELGDFIQALPLNTKQNDTLIALIIKQLNEAERSAFAQGVKFAFSIEDALNEAEEEEDDQDDPAPPKTIH